MNRFYLKIAPFVLGLPVFGIFISIIAIMCFPSKKDLDIEVYMRMLTFSLAFVIGPSLYLIAFTQVYKLLQNNKKSTFDVDPLP